MIGKLTIVVSICLLCLFPFDTFKKDQLRYQRVRQAYQDKEERMLALLATHQLQKEGLELYLRAFKQERLIELWGKSSSNAAFTLIKTYAVCQTSGALGPKRQQGDWQIPEGFYHIDRFNPHSNFYLSLGINYPNRSDRLLGVQGNLGGDIFIHGNCVTIGCLPITNEQIKELYIFCVEAKSSGQKKIPVTIFPAKLTDAAWLKLKQQYEGDTDKLGLWADLKKGFDVFNSTRQLPNIGFLPSGRHTVQ